VIATAAEVPTWIIAGEGASVAAERRLVESGAEVLRVGAPGGRVDVGAALRLLGARGITRVFSEGGPSVGAALLAADLVDVLALATSRTALCEAGVPALGPKSERLCAERFTRLSTEDLGADRLDTFERQR
jgi:diaminohydroxyphosphoribosylaminopyrimidine deaminase/5-amino-6-(5-phosphoribosylamino)uracil reductase